MPTKKPAKPVKAVKPAKPAVKSAVKPAVKAVAKAVVKPAAKKTPLKTVAVKSTKPAVKAAGKPSPKVKSVPASKSPAPVLKRAPKPGEKKDIAKAPTQAAAEPMVEKTAKAAKPAKAEKAEKREKATKAPAAKSDVKKSAATGAKRGRKPKAAAGGDLDDADMADIEDDLEGEPVTAEATTEKVKPLRMKISKAKERALIKEFGLDDTVLSEEDLAVRRLRLKALIKLGKTRGYLTHGEISDHLPDKLVDAETLAVVINMLKDMGVSVFEQTPDVDAILNSGETVASEEEAEEEAEAAIATVDSEFGRTTDPVRMYMR